MNSMTIKIGVWRGSQFKLDFPKKMSDAIQELEASAEFPELVEESGGQEVIIPFPYQQVFMVSVISFFEPVMFGLVFPFSYYMVKSFNVARGENEIGLFVGLLASSFSFAQLFTSLPWGWLSDRYGRRPALLFGLFGNAATCLLFGTSKTFGFALTMRLLNGLLNGNMAIAKAVLGEITTSDQRGLAFAYWETAYGTGTIVGPILGGLLSDPVQQYPNVFGQSALFTEFPYLFPCLVSSGLTIVGCILGFFFLEESNHRLPNIEEVTDEGEYDSDIKTPKKVFGNLNASVGATILCYGTWCLINVLYEELFPLFAATPLKYGGLQASAFEIGIVLSASGIAQLVAQIVIYPWMETRFGYVRTFRVASILFTVVAFSLPFISTVASKVVETNGGNYGSNEKLTVFIPLFIDIAFKTIASVLGYVPVIIFGLIGLM
jgi:MFS family permease